MWLKDYKHLIDIRYFFYSFHFRWKNNIQNNFKNIKLLFRRGEVNKFFKIQSKQGNKWSKIAKEFPGM